MADGGTGEGKVSAVGRVPCRPRSRLRTFAPASTVGGWDGSFSGGGFRVRIGVWPRPSSWPTAWWAGGGGGVRWGSEYLREVRLSPPAGHPGTVAVALTVGRCGDPSRRPGRRMPYLW